MSHPGYLAAGKQGAGASPQHPLEQSERCHDAELETQGEFFKVNYATPQRQNLSGKQTWQRSSKVRCGILHVTDQSFEVDTRNKAIKISALTHSYKML